ncbi:U-box domain-containing protein 17 [Cardamine amara subsp. amara]|uniref:RING-type E3 ubiquitin transferase n=1 Tax=Cardamine amara subsp. amara TaxID=228776 RepID=A0ABD1BQ22_CARAN
MATEAIYAAIIAFSRRRRSPSLEVFLPTTVDLSGVPLTRSLASISAEVISCFRGVRFFFQRRNARSLIRKIEVLLVLFEYLADSGWDSNSEHGSVPSAAVLCFKELYLFLHRSKFLLYYCAQSSKLWLLLQNPSLSEFFHDLNRDILTLLDVFPINSLNLSDDIKELIELLHHQSSKSTLFFIDNNDEMLRHRFYSFLDGFENGQIPNLRELRSFFVDKLEIKDPNSCRAEIEFLEDQIMSHECDDLEPTRSVINGFVDITRYCMFSLFGFEDDGFEWRIDNTKKQRKYLIAQEIKDTFTSLPKDFVCSISLNLMNDPVIVSTGQTYDRSSIVRWIEEGHSTCPKTGQKLVDSSSCIVPNRALRNLITCWCAATDSEFPDSPNESPALVLQTRASIELNKATVLILIKKLADGSELAQTVAAREIRLLTKTVRIRRALIAEAGAIPHLCRLLNSKNAIAQENSVTAMLNLSTHEENKSRIMEENDCLESIVSVLASGLTMEARGNAAATLYSLSIVNGYKTRIANADGCIESLALLVQNGMPRGRKDATNALYSIWLHPDNCSRIVNLGGVSALVGALADEAVAERATGVLGAVASQSVGAEAIGREESAVVGLIELMRCGTPLGKEKAVATLLQLCTSGEAAVVEKVVRAPALAGLTQKLMRTGTDRARRKATALALVL